MRFLALSGGSPGGNTEQALLAALRAAQETATTPATISLIRLKELSIGSEALDGHLPLPVVGQSTSTAGTVPDDRPFMLDQIMEADAIILGAPCMTRTLPWEVKRFQDSTLGPFQDVTMAKRLVDTGKGDLVDQRIFKPRVLALVTLGGASTTEWAPFTLPLLHQVFFPLGAQIIDQMQVFGTGVPDSFLCNGEAVARAEELGRNLAQQARATMEGEATYVGPRGMCPVCHLSMFNFVGREAVDCATCGAKGRMGVGEDGKVVFVTDADGESFSVLRRSGLEKHLRDLEHAFQVEEVSPKVSDIKEEFVKLGQNWVVAPPSRVTK